MQMKFYLNLVGKHMATNLDIQPEGFQGTQLWPVVRQPLFSCSRFILVGFKTNNRSFLSLQGYGASMEFYGKALRPS